MSPQKVYTPSFWQRFFANTSLVWGMVTVITVVVCAALGAYAKKYLNREFIGEQTRLLQQCRENPKFNRDRCEKLLVERGEIKQPRYSKTMRSPQRPPFLLSDSDADLTPPPR